MQYCTIVQLEFRMDIVTDTSVLLAVVLNEPERQRIIGKTKGAQLFGPAVIPWEVGNAFTAMLKRKRMELAEAKAAYDAFEKIPLRYVHVDIGRALEIAKKVDCYAYDAYFLQCAMDIGAPVMSLDRAFVVQAQDLGLGVLEV